MPFAWCDYLYVVKQGTPLTIKYFQNFTFKEDKNYCISPSPLHGGGIDHNQCFLESSLAMEVLPLAADGFHPPHAHPHGQRWEMWSEGEPSHALGGGGSHGSTTSFWAALGGSPRWALFLIRCMCGPVVSVHVKHPLASWVQTKGHGPLVMSACAGGLLLTWWTLRVPSSWVLWIQQFCQSPEPIGPWETSTDLTSLSSLLPLVFWFLFLHECSQVPIEPIHAGSHKRHLYTIQCLFCMLL